MKLDSYAPIPTPHNSIKVMILGALFLSHHNSGWSSRVSSAEERPTQLSALPLTTLPNHRAKGKDSWSATTMVLQTNSQWNEWHTYLISKLSRFMDISFLFISGDDLYAHPSHPSSCALQAAEATALPKGVSHCVQLISGQRCGFQKHNLHSTHPGLPWSWLLGNTCRRPFRSFSRHHFPLNLVAFLGATKPSTTWNCPHPSSLSTSSSTQLKESRSLSLQKKRRLSTSRTTVQLGAARLSEQGGSNKSDCS